MGIVKLFINDVEKNLHSVELTKEGERAIDQIRLKVPKAVEVIVNQELKYLQDMVDLTKLIAVYNLQGNTEDESGYSHNGTASNITYGTDTWGGKSAIFNGSNGNISVSHNSRFDFSDSFDTYVWAKWTSTTTGMYLLSKRVEGDVFQDNVYQDNVFSTSGDAGIFIQVNAATAGDVRVQVGGTVITSSTAGFNDGEWHLIRLSRDINNLVTLSIDTVSRGTATVSGTATTAEDLTIGSDFYGNYFNGEISRVRLYSAMLTSNMASSIYTNRNPRSVIKFGGKITKIDSALTERDNRTEFWKDSSRD